MHEKPKLQCTRDYTIFEMHETNRPLHNDRRLEKSMRSVGFMPSSPIQCIRNGGGTLKVIRGHHRLDMAKRLNLPVWYVVDESKVDIFDLEGGQQQWNTVDFVCARASSGDADCAFLIEFQKKHRIPLAVAASLVGGESAGSNNRVKNVKEGTFRVAEDLSHAYAVVEITDFCRENGLAFAGSAAFISAISMALRVPEFDASVFCRRVEKHGSVMRKVGTRNEYLDEIDSLYNHSARANRLPLAFLAKKIGRERHATIGGHIKPKPEKKLAAAAKQPVASGIARAATAIRSGLGLRS